ncbi:MAG TPA: hypothetical protein VEP67_05120, partial [Thiobacillaceae bacterium]|nr:hypothetical protein [Thiobacillaceae bacterium]
CRQSRVRAGLPTLSRRDIVLALSRSAHLVDQFLINRPRKWRRLVYGITPGLKSIFFFSLPQAKFGALRHCIA